MFCSCGSDNLNLRDWMNVYLEFKLRYLKNLKLFSTKIKDLFEPVVLLRKTDEFLRFSKTKKNQNKTKQYKTKQNKIKQKQNKTKTKKKPHFLEKPISR